MWAGTGGYDSAFGGGGGGYTQSPGGFASPSATQDEKKSRSRSQNIVPCTVSQLLSAEQVDDTFRVLDVELSQVLIVGIIRQAEKAPTNILYKVDDMSASPMDVRQWVDTDEEGNDNVVVPPGTYVKVAGHLRSFQNKKSLVAFKIMPLEDMNELTTHLLEVVNAHMILRHAHKFVNMSEPSSVTGMESTSTYEGNNAMPSGGLTLHQTQILKLIQNCTSSEGISLEDLKNRLPSINLPTLKKAVEFLSSEGHIYSTIDDEHFKSTDAE
ncbi:replication protein A 32 kDa subunit isoform X3 [Anolis carolinensis]|uniref:Replication factor A protein 2 n=1 Tax=Anolis carolinensis TaxID=28377 RepID=H9GPH6_ANOCA|nr:PREDICTED: replication protein A 32 kDa subunit [Anolis carolinensis]|eukprot:XP_003228909.1 PREDICTED: replication protein A 32 kDa subunit [Anolis carolinensis]